RARAVILATGAQYRKLPLPELARFEGVGVYYGATSVERQFCGDEEIVVVGGGNSAGQAAVYLAETARHVHVVGRGPGLAATMSRPPLLLETSMPAVFAVGDVRAGSVKRVASAVGEGSICVQLVHKVLAE